MNLPLVAMLMLGAVGSTDELCDDADHCGHTHIEKYEGNSVEFSFGYLGQWADERNRQLELKPSDTNPAGAGAVTDPFMGVPYSGTVLAGPILEWRGIHKNVRLTVGVRFPFANFRPSDTAQTMMIGGMPRDVLVRSVSLWDFRTGIGFEVPFKRVTPFVDVLGDVQTINTQLSIDGATANYTGRAFSLGGRLGARYQVDHLFVALAAEATAIGPLRIGGTLQVGMGF